MQLVGIKNSVFKINILDEILLLLGYKRLEMLKKKFIYPTFRHLVWHCQASIHLITVFKYLLSRGKFFCLLDRYVNKINTI